MNVIDLEKFLTKGQAEILESLLVGDSGHAQPGLLTFEHFSQAAKIDKLLDKLETDTGKIKNKKNPIRYKKGFQDGTNCSTSSRLTQATKRHQKRK